MGALLKFSVERRFATAKNLEPKIISSFDNCKKRMTGRGEFTLCYICPIYRDLKKITHYNYRNLYRKNKLYDDIYQVKNPNNNSSIALSYPPYIIFLYEMHLIVTPL